MAVAEREKKRYRVHMVAVPETVPRIDLNRDLAQLLAMKYGIVATMFTDDDMGAPGSNKVEIAQDLNVRKRRLHVDLVTSDPKFADEIEFWATNTDKKM